VPDRATADDTTPPRQPGPSTPTKLPPAQAKQPEATTAPWPDAASNGKARPRKAWQIGAGAVMILVLFGLMALWAGGAFKARTKALQPLADVTHTIEAGRTDADVWTGLNTVQKEISAIRQAATTSMNTLHNVHVGEALRQLERATKILKTGTLPPPSAEAGLAELAQAREHL